MKVTKSSLKEKNSPAQSRRIRIRKGIRNRNQIKEQSHQDYKDCVDNQVRRRHEGGKYS